VIRDTLTVARKEWKEFLLSGSGLKGGRLGLLVMLVTFGVVLPVNSGISWLTSPTLLLAWAWVPLMLVSGVVADSFAGERERHTIETLLASRLSDGAILAGKLVAAVAYAWGFTMVMALVSLVSVNAFHWQGRVTWFPAQTAVGVPAFSFLTSLLTASAGVLVSLRAPTARQAAQALSIGVMLVLFVPFLGFQALPAEWKAMIGQGLLALGPRMALVALGAAIAVADVLLLAAAVARFRRARLILD
jgi:ABC-2 type transport system permease protein